MAVNTPVPRELEPWRARKRAQLLAMLGPYPERVPLDLETTEVVDCGSWRWDKSRPAAS